MSNAPMVEVQGIKELRRTMKKAGEDLADLKDVHQRAGEIVAGVAQQLAPKRSGNLAGSIRASRLASGVQVKAGGANIAYANAIHWGWRARRIEASLYLTNAASQTEAQWFEMYSQEVDKIIERVEGDK